ncbi:MAG: monomethylamine:corrinoid methyltransferase, partial [Candidatus Korarchaeota archaeon]|nr:monomethylamine:corrinoid methyltransferase [Candidatus Korarchaeota archaeon]
VKEALRQLPEAYVMGEGKDRIVMRARKPEDTTPPVLHGGPTGTLCSEGDVYLKTLISYAKEPVVDSLGAGSLRTVNGVVIRTASPLNFRAARIGAEMAREALIRAGRPGLHINDVAVVVPEAKLAALDPHRGIRPSDGLLVSQMVEFKVSLHHLSLVEHLLAYGCFISDLMTPIQGGYAGGPEGTAIVTVAEHLLGLMCYHAEYHFLSLTHMLTLNNTDRGGLWIVSIVGQALSRNTRILSAYDCYVSSGPGTDMILREVAAGGITASVSGIHLEGVGSAGGKLVDHATGLECRFLGEVGKSSAGLRRSEANEIVKELLKEYEDRLTSAPKGKTFQELYDMYKVEPKEEWRQKYEAAYRRIEGLGISIRF